MMGPDLTILILINLALLVALVVLLKKIYKKRNP